MAWSLRVLATLLIGALPPALAWAQAPQEPAQSTTSTGAAPARNRHFQVSRASSPIRVDARLDETAWQDAEVIPLPFEITPGDNTPARYDTDCRVTFDEDHIYLGCEAFDPDPSSIRAFITNRDGIFGNHDRISFLLDPFNDSRRGFVFEISALGVQADLSYDERTQFDARWDGIWESAGRITERGYVVEAAIPFRTLRFPRSSDAQTWRFWINRMRPRTDIVVMRTNTRIRGESCQLCQAHLLHGFSGMAPGLNAELVPTMTGRRTASLATTAPGGPLTTGPADLDPGLDARWSLTTNMSLNATLNPDFSQVETDSPQLSANTTFALRFPEKRPFFLEGGDLFQTPMEVLFTRTVADPAGGLKLTGKDGSHALGVLATLDEVNNLIIPGAFGSDGTSLDNRVGTAAIRYRRDVGGNNTLGAIYTGRFSRGGYRNQVAGLDAYVQLTPSLTWTTQALASDTRYDGDTRLLFGQPSGAFLGQALRTTVAFNGRAWFADAGSEIRSAGFRADAGFVPQTGSRNTFLGGGYTLRGDGGLLTLLQAGAGVYNNEQTGGGLLSEGSWLNLFYEGPLQSTAWFNPNIERSVFDGETHELFSVFAGGSVRPLSWLRLGMSSKVGDEIDFRNNGSGTVRRLSPSFDAQIGRHVEVGSRHSVQRLTKDGALVFRARVDELKGTLNLSTRVFLRGILQYRRTERTLAENPGLMRLVDEDLFAQFLLSYKVNPLTVAFLGLIDDRIGFEDLDDGRRGLTPRERTLFFKLGYAWRP